MLKKLHDSDYDKYLAHQKSKLDAYFEKDYKRQSLDDLAARHYKILMDRMKRVKTIGQRVLCLAARLGQEVQVFRDLGAFAVGIDLNPGPDNKYVHYGDFQNIPFPAGSVDTIYTNSLDHAFDLGKMAAECLRVIKRNGTLILEIQEGDDFGVKAEQWEATWWDSPDDAIAVFKAAGFCEIERYTVYEPFRAVNITMTPDLR